MKIKNWDIEFPETLKVKCDDKEIAYLCKVILHNILHIDDITLNICESNTMVDKFSNKGIEINAFLVKTQLKGNYVLYLREGWGIPLVLCHEMVHLKQYHTEQLDTEDNLTFTWKGDEYNSSTGYNDRPWEKEAFSLQNKLKKQLKKLVK